MVAVFLTKIQPVNALPYRFFLTLNCSGASLVGGTALAVDQKLRQDILAGLTALLSR